VNIPGEHLVKGGKAGGNLSRSEEEKKDLQSMAEKKEGANDLSNELNEEEKMQVKKEEQESRGKYSEEYVNENEEETELEKLEARVEVLKQEKEEVTEMLQRVKADFDNYRKRAQKEKEQAGFKALFDFIYKLLPIIDNIDRALENARREKVGETFIEGMEMIKKQLKQVLEQEGVAHIEAEGSEFDPSLHQAVMKTEEGEGENNTVVEVFQEGYVMQERVLRPAMVKVLVKEEGKEKEETSAGEERNRQEE